MNTHIPQEPALIPSLWVKKYFQNMYNYTCSHIGGDCHTAQDIVQDTFLSALNSMEMFRGLCSEKTWLYAILRHRITDYYRHRSRHFTTCFSAMNPFPSDVEDFSPWENNIPCPAPLPDSILENKQLYAEINRSLELLPSRQRQVFTMKNIEDISSSDICRTLKISDENYWVLMHRARTGLKCLLLKKVR